MTAPPQPVADYQIQNFEELRDIFPQFFKSSKASNGHAS